MTSGEFKEIAQAMKEFEISHVKMGDCEFTRGGVISSHSQILNSVPIANPIHDPNDPIKHKVDQMTSLMKLSDSELVDQLFPDKSDEEHA
jgi:hypothetical protein